MATNASNTSSVRPEPPRTRPSRYHLITPTDWFRVPLRSEGKRERAVTSLVDRTFPNRDQHAAQRRELRDMLTGIVDRAARSDGIELYLSTHAVLGVPVPASLLVSAEPENPRLPDAIPVELLADGLREKYGERAEVAMVALPCGPAVRCRRRELTDDARDLGVSPDRPSTLLEVYVPVPGSRAWLLLTFSAPLPELADAQVEMFDVIAASLRWSREG